MNEILEDIRSHYDSTYDKNWKGPLTKNVLLNLIAIILFIIHYFGEFFNGQDKMEVGMIYLFAALTIIYSPSSVAYQNIGELLIHP